MNELVSIVVPVHNAEKYLRKCLDSILNQTYENIEVILINDTSSDYSSDICLAYRKKDRRIKYYEVQLSSAGKSRTFGMEKALGKWLIFVDADDYIESNMIEILYETVNKNHLESVFCKFNVLSNDSNEEKVTNFINKKTMMKYEEDEIKNNFIFSAIYVTENSEMSMYAVWHGIYNIDIIKKYNIKFEDENKYLSEDSIFNFEYLSKCKSIGIIEDALYNHILFNNNSICNIYNTRYDFIDVWYDKILQVALDNNIDIEKTTYCLSERYVEFFICKIRQEILLANAPIYMKLKKIRRMVTSNRIQTVLNKINYVNRTKGNKILLKLIKYKMSLTIYLLIFLKFRIILDKE